MELETHLAIDRALCGEVTHLEERRAIVSLETSDRMAADDQGLVHGGFVFGAADYSAMAAVNDPKVVLGSAEVRFLAPVAVGERVEFEAQVDEIAGRKHTVSVLGRVGDREIFRGTFVCFVLDHHVLGSVQ